MKISIIFLILILFIYSPAANAQVEISGLIDFQVAQGGKDSQFISNGIANEFRKPHLEFSEFNFFVHSQIDENYTFDARLKWDTWGSGKVGRLKAPLAMLTWQREESPLLISLGRFINPFGLYPRRLLSVDNLFGQPPLAYGYFINITDKDGFWPIAGESGSYGSDDVGLTTIYFGGYSTGLLLGWNFLNNRLTWDIALTNGTLAFQDDYGNLDNWGVVTRLGFQPFIFWQQGLSAGYGSLMQKSALNNAFDNLESFNQLVLGTDLILAYSYFELSGEFIYSFWKTPVFGDSGFISVDQKKLQQVNLKNYSAYVDLKYEPSFFTGSYLALRYEILNFEEYQQNNLLANLRNPWDDDVSRYSVAFGYKLTRSVLCKLSYMDQKTENSATDPDDYVLSGMISVLF